MKRITFSQVLKNAKIDIKKEYSRLYCMFYGKTEDSNSVEKICDENFDFIPFKDTCTSLMDFNETYEFNFVEQPSDFDENYLILFCEYSYNLSKYNCGRCFSFDNQDIVRDYIIQVRKVIEKIGYMENDANGITEFVPRDQAAISVAEIVEPTLSYRVIEYNHHSMKGDLDKKRSVILALANKLEAEKEKLRQINKTLEKDLAYLFNNVNIRHNNIDGEKTNNIASMMGEEEIEQWYDDTYQMCLLAFLELEHMGRKKRIDELKCKHKKVEE